MTVEDVVRAFVDSINHGDLERLASLMSADHTFIDSDGSEVTGREAMLEGWSRFLSAFPDYHIAADEIFRSRDTVVVVGQASGTYTPDGRSEAARPWQVPAAWRAVVRKGHVVIWQVFVNPEPILASMR